MDSGYMKMVIDLAEKVKKAMLAKGKTRGWTKCPKCAGKVRCSISGKRNHLHMACETKGCIWMME